MYNGMYIYMHTYTHTHMRTPIYNKLDIFMLRHTLASSVLTDPLQTDFSANLAPVHTDNFQIE